MPFNARRSNLEFNLPSLKSTDQIRMYLIVSRNVGYTRIFYSQSQVVTNCLQELKKDSKSGSRQRTVISDRCSLNDCPQRYTISHRFYILNRVPKRKEVPKKLSSCDVLERVSSEGFMSVSMTTISKDRQTQLLKCYLLCCSKLYPNQSLQCVHCT